MPATKPYSIRATKKTTTYSIMKTEDGAYYAIKGFIYQFDKTILEILNQNDENKFVKIEQEQDLEYENYVVQVKYYETVYTKPQQKQKIKDATLKLMTDFALDETKQYCLFVYFNGEDKKIIKHSSVSELDKLLGSKSNMFHSSFKEKFIKNYTLVYATNFQKQFNNVINMIKSEYNCKEEAFIYHAIIRNHLLNLITDNSKTSYTQRQCNKKTITNIVNQTKSKIIHSAYAKYLGEVKYTKFLKKQLSNINYTYNNYIFFGNNITEKSTFSFSHLIKNIADKYFNYKNLSKAKPFTIIVDKPQKELLEIKKQLIRLNIRFNDGYEGYGEFSEQIFKEQPLIRISKPQKTSFSVRIISFKTFKNIKTINLPDMIYIFGDNFNKKTLFDEPTTYFSIDNIELNQMFELFK